jgi:hypothetical protein
VNDIVASGMRPFSTPPDPEFQYEFYQMCLREFGRQWLLTPTIAVLIQEAMAGAGREARRRCLLHRETTTSFPHPASHRQVWRRRI